MRRLFLFLFVLVAVASPVAALAQAPPCDCFCTGSRGATSPGKLTPEQCATRCQTDGGENMVTCARSAAEFPGNLPRCFTPERCAAQEGVFDQEQPRECVSGEHYCFANTKANPIKLSIGIGGKTSVSDLGQYINIGYNFLLASALTLAIVMLMVGGVQYTMAGATGDVEAAKGRIKNAIMGLLLLFGAYVILFTINPNLVKLTPPQLPMVKTILSAGVDTCETFKRNGYTIDPSTGACGEKQGTIKTGPGGAQVAAGSTCEFRFCASGSACFGEGETAECLNCQEMVPNNPTGIQPSNNLCNALKLPDVPATGRLKQVANYCFHTTDKELETTLRTLGTLTFLLEDVGICAQLTIDCSSVNECGDYDTKQAFSGQDHEEMEDLDPGKNGLDLITLCAQDPCGAAEKEGVTRCSGDANDCRGGSTRRTARGTGQSCESDSECLSGICVDRPGIGEGNWCQPSGKTSGDVCSENRECASNSCVDAPGFGSGDICS